MNDSSQKEKQQRDFVLSVRLRPEIREKLGFVSDSVGVSPATLATMAIGEFVSLKFAALTTSQQITQQVVNAITPAALDMLAQQFAAPQQLDAEAQAFADQIVAQNPHLFQQPQANDDKEN